MVQRLGVGFAQGAYVSMPVALEEALQLSRRGMTAGRQKAQLPGSARSTASASR